MERVDHGVDRPESEAVAFVHRPVHDVIPLDLGFIADEQPVAACAIKQELGLQSLVARRKPRRIAGPHPVGVGHENHMESPFGRPRRVLYQPVKCVTGHPRVVVGGVVTQLVQISIPFIGNALAVTIHIHARKRGGLDRIPAQLPDAVEYLVG